MLITSWNGRVRGFALSLAASGVALGCQRSGAETLRAFVVRDSGGVSVATNADSSHSRIEHWQVRSIPDATIGSSVGDTGQQLFRVLDAKRLDNGRILVLNAGTHEVRSFDANADLLWSVGREGAGPREFRRPLRLLPGADGGVLVLDGSGRLTAISGNGVLDDALVIDPRRTDNLRDFSPFLSRYILDDTTVVLLWLNFGTPVSGRGMVTGEVAVLMNREDSLRHVASMELSEVTVVDLPDRTARFGVAFGRSGQLGFGRNPARIVTGSDNRWELRVHCSSGRLAQIIRVEREAQDVSNADMARWKAEARQRYQDNPDLPHLERFWARMDPAPTKPFFGGIVGDAAGNLWVERYQFPNPARVTYDVISASGKYFAEVTLPQGLEPLDIGADYVLGRWRDENDVEFLHLHRIVKPRTRSRQEVRELNIPSPCL